MSDDAARAAGQRRSATPWPTDLAHTLFVEAGAGSGKTTVLVNRVCALVESGVDIRKIAAITFTEKAAAELRLRVREELEARGTEAGDAARAVARRSADVDASRVRSSVAHRARPRGGRAAPVRCARRGRRGDLPRSAVARPRGPALRSHRSARTGRAARGRARVSRRGASETSSSHCTRATTDCVRRREDGSGRLTQSTSLPSTRRRSCSRCRC